MRRKPVSRNEVRIADFRIVTMPADSVREGEDSWRAEPIERLWKPLIAQLTKEQADHEASPSTQAHREEVRKHVPGLRIKPAEPPNIPYPRGRAQSCRHCEREFYRVGMSVSRYCTDACKDAAQARARAPRVAAMVKARSEARASARADRTCPACGEPIAAERATKRFCSTRCRMRASRHTGSLKSLAHDPSMDRFKGTDGRSLTQREDFSIACLRWPAEAAEFARKLDKARK